ncbi:AGBL4 [Lepeophtheirus salmonis]|uniref:AGBL4 n=1 Tax=Lepeophtheirus salmonis TaxID=72036 RepID=A0A7R8H519_LEPSM|nr:AGBL4 [Lepeophtheirus salmonis]CAF2854685.1 AGBL4 [Lepeophtheirus salmonis]
MTVIFNSDDSDTEGGLGNIERVVMRPPGHSGKAKRGHLCFDASFETGNLGRVDFITENEYDLFIRPDTCNPRYGLSPVVKSSSRPRWQRLPKENVYYYVSPEHSNAFVLSFAFAFDIEDGEHYSFALSYPYSYSRCMEVLHNLAKEKPGICQLESLTKTIQDRDLPCITITEEFIQNTEEDHTEQETNTPELPNKNSTTQTNSTSNEENSGEFKRVVIIMGRSHPGDSPVSFVIQGFLNFLVSDHQIAKELRQKIIFKILPMMNPDGVYLGNSRCNLLGADLNRCWSLASKHIPTINATKSLIMDFYKTDRLDFVLDLHASSNLMGCFIQGNSYDSVYRFEHPEKEGTARRYLCKEIGEKNQHLLSGVLNVWNYRKFQFTHNINPVLQRGRLFNAWTTISKGTLGQFQNFQDLQTGFSMLRLQELSKQREMYSSLESFSSNDSRDREGSSGSESSCSDEGEMRRGKKVKRKRKKRKDKKEFNYEELVEFTKMSFRRKVLENETSDEGIKVVGHNIFPSSRLSIHEDNFIPPSCIVNLNESLPKTPCSPDPVERLLSIERIRLRTSSMESPPLKSLRSSPIVIGGGGVISSRWKKGEKSVSETNLGMTSIY